MLAPIFSTVFSNPILSPMADSKYSEEIKFYKPKLRFIIPISNFQYPKKLFNEFKKTKYCFKIDNNFAKVIELCKEIKRKDRAR